jgi:subtilisin family serine protease
MGVIICLLALAPAGFAQNKSKDTVILLVKTISGLDKGSAEKIASRHGLIDVSDLPTVNIRYIEVNAGKVSQATKELLSDPYVQNVDADNLRMAASASDDTLYNTQWSLPKIGWDKAFGVVAPQFSSKVAILDTGVDAGHPDLVGNIGTGTSFVDGSGGMNDLNGHGTWLAGIVAGRTNNATGVAGVAYSGVEILPVKVLGSTGIGWDSDIIKGIYWSVDIGHADVILMAFSNTGYSAAMQEAVDYAWAHNVVVVAAAGNEGSNQPAYPAALRGVISVAATTEKDQLYQKSNFGSSIFVGAPGTDIVGAYPYNYYVKSNGTSGAAGIVAGAAALMRAVDFTLTNGVIVNRIGHSATAPANQQNQMGHGRLNLAGALADTSMDFVQPAGVVPGN